jgi:hypothetical protein
MLLRMHEEKEDLEDEVVLLCSLLGTTFLCNSFLLDLYDAAQHLLTWRTFRAPVQ